MADIIQIDPKIQDAREKKEAQIKKQKQAAVRNMLLRAKREFRCERCFQEIELQELSDRSEQEKLRVPYLFCEICAEEYIDYIERLKGKGDPECYWRSDVWLEVWKRWIDYKGTLDRYLRSKEFRKLLEELKQPDPDQ